MTDCTTARGRILRGFLPAILLWSCCFVGVARANPDPERVRTLVHVLDYLAADYPGAVRGGAVIDELEFEEMVQFAAIADSLVRSLVAAGTLPDDAGLLDSVRRLGGEIHALADPTTVASLARSIRDLAVARSGLTVAPATWPDIAAGGVLFGTWCASCHGAEGRGDGPAAPALNPAPANLAEGERIAGIAPFQAFNTIRLGVDGTAMAGFPQLSEREAWEIAFFVKSLRTAGTQLSGEDARPHASLVEIASLNDPDLEKLLAGRGVADAHDVVGALRVLGPPTAGAASLELAESLLARTLEAYRSGDRGAAQAHAVAAYLEGVEPIEPLLRAADASLVVDVEEAMLAVRGAVQKGRPAEEVERAVAAAGTVLREARGAIGGQASSAWLTFGLALSILLREALEAFLVIITILGLIRVSGQPTAARWVHAGWLAAVLVGLAGWFLVDAIIRLSAASREVMEGGIALFAVVVLLSVGFWLHDTSSSRKWKAFVDRRVRQELGRGSLVGLASFSFFVVFREAFESVLFLSALGLDGGESAGTAIGAATLVTLVVVLVGGTLAVRYSTRLPIRQMFRYASLVVVVLAVVLTGKGVHALQEAGTLPASLTGHSFRLELLGVYPTVESILAQIAVAGTVVLLWMLSRRLELKAVRG